MRGSISASRALEVHKAKHHQVQEKVHTKSPSLIAPSALVTTLCLRLCWLRVRLLRHALLPKKCEFLRPCKLLVLTPEEWNDITLPDITVAADYFHFLAKKKK